MRKDKFTVGEKGSIEENIKRLERELDESFKAVKGAPRIKELSEAEEKEQTPVAEQIPEPPAPDIAVPKRKTVPHYYTHRQHPEESFNPFRSSRFYIVVFGIVAFAAVIFKAPVFKYTTPFRPDSDLPQIEVGFRYYNNILGRQTRSETIVNVGNDKITVRMPMSEWVNLPKEKKLLILKYVQKQK